MKKTCEVVRYSPTLDFGLCAEQLKERKESGLINKVKESSEKTYLRIVIDNVFTFFNIAMLSLAVLLVAVVGPQIITNLSFVLIIACNTIIGIYQECKCKKTLHKLKLISTNKITVIRCGKQEQILPQEIYLDDIIILQPGDQVPADCIIMSDGIYEVNESLMTGESCAIKKHLGDQIIAGSYIISGKCYARANKIAKDTYLYSIESKAKGFKKPKSNLIISLNKIIKLLVYIAIPIGLIVGWTSLVHTDALSAVKWGSLSITYSVPAGMVLLASVAMMASVVKLAGVKVLTQDIYSVESLSRVDMLCLDKTGTLTDGTMVVEKVIYYFDDIEKSGLMSSYLSAFNTSNQTQEALIEKFGVENHYTIIKSMPFSSDRKYSLVEFENLGTYALGAPEYLTSNIDILQSVEDYASHGLRVLLLVKSNKWGIDIEKNQIVAMFLIRDNIRQGVADTIQWFNQNDVGIRVISGDNVKTVSYIAQTCNIKNSDRYIDLSTIDTSDKEKFRDIVLSHYIYGRVTPEQKAEIIDILRQDGYTVGMTGDGVNDIISLKKADCAIALGSGAPATKNVSNFILMDDDFNHMKNAVYCGRTVVNNVQRSSSLFIMKDVLWLIMMILPMIFGLSHIYEPTIISIINILITGVATTLLAIEPSSEKIEGDFFTTVLSRAFIAGVYMSLPIIFIFIYAFIACGLDIQSVEQTIAHMMPIASICVTIAGFVIFYFMSIPFTTYRKFVFILVLAGAILLLLAIPDFFLKNGTEHLQELIDYGSLPAAISAIIYNLFSFEIYRTFTLQQWIIISIFLLISSTLYILTNKVVAKISKNKIKVDAESVFKRRRKR